MKRFFISLFLIVFTIFNFNSSYLVNAGASAKSYIVMDCASKEVLEGDNIHSSYSVASISKIMTAILALESDYLFTVCVVGEEIKNAVGSSIYLKEGERIVLIDLVYGLMLRSGNDAAHVIALTLSDSMELFASKMNEKAKEIGMKDSLFHNPSGLDIDDEGNISSAYDMAILMRYCLKNDLFCQIINTETYRTPTRVFQNKNRLLKSYEHLIGGKTGYTAKAKRTLVNAAEKDGQVLIVVTLSCGNDFSLHRQLFEKYFNGFHYLLLLNKGINSIGEYIIDCDYGIGIRFPKSIELKGTLVYEVDIYETKLHIYFILLNNVKYEGGIFEIKNIRKI